MAIRCDDVQITVWMKWAEYKKHTKKLWSEGGRMPKLSVLVAGFLIFITLRDKKACQGRNWGH